MADEWDVIDEPRVEVDEIIDVGDGETVVSVHRTLGRARHTQLNIGDLRWAAVWTIRRAKALRARGYMSRGKALEAAGLRE
jgi:hypothetical protein